MNAETQTTAKDFTMIYDGTERDFSWIADGIDTEDVRSIGVENWVRAYVRGTIAGWNQTRATDETVYRVWRRESGEFNSLVQYVKEYIS